ncbi:hypothetical protein KP79_PYT24655 [Mizuhopecten yessoensis]|uniref:Uncharacterized protein n=1 Tax=Mizuhopecten yessoensis TaxID=6573 RepID=A0A210PJ30_MIZYE|nr:hypothetical protein KP79_PYT24655 [Mizuhopecten yessoensis]
MDGHQLRVFVVMLSSIVIQICIVRGEVLVPYKGNNYVECPSGSYQVEFSSNCTDNCPPNAPYIVSD